jgi:hypothetical protein
VNVAFRPVRVCVKALSLFVLLNLLYAFTQPHLASVSVYNTLVPGLSRMPFGNVDDPYTITVDDADVMFSSHAISAPKQSDEIRVAVVGDSSVWGEGLSVKSTLAAQWNELGTQCGAKRLKVYNLGYPHPSIIKDVIFMKELASRSPDVVVWLVTLNTFMKQAEANPFLLDNRSLALQIMDTYSIPFAPRKALTEAGRGFYGQTLLGQRSLLARWTKLQALGLVWAATGSDVQNPIEPVATPAPLELPTSLRYRGLRPGADLRKSLLLTALDAGYGSAGKVPILLVNEPIYVAAGGQSQSHYNYLYPRWAYDQYRELVASKAQSNSWAYLDLWNAIPPARFMDPALHLDPNGEMLLAEELNAALWPMVCR